MYTYYIQLYIDSNASIDEHSAILDRYAYMSAVDLLVLTMLFFQHSTDSVIRAT